MRANYLIAAIALVGCAQTAQQTAVPATIVTVATTTPPPTVGSTTSTLPPTTVAPEPDAGCALQGPSAAIDRDRQKAWLCLDGVITAEFPVSTAWSMPDPGEYQVYAKDRVTTSTFGGYTSTLRNFVAFTYGENTGARVAFHAIPILGDGSLVQPIESVGDLSRRGESSGCIRVAPDIAELIWNSLEIGDTVTVLT